MIKAITKPLTVVFIAAALNVSATASAQFRAYAVIKNPLVPAGDADAGAAVKINTHLLLAACPQFVHHEFWYGVDPGRTFVEVGFKNGQAFSGKCVSPSIFWAEMLPGNNYHEHFPAVSFSFDTWYQLWVGTGGQLYLDSKHRQPRTWAIGQ
jgi:hypothetical protein